MDKFLIFLFTSCFLLGCGSGSSSTTSTDQQANDQWKPFTENATPNKSGHLIDSAVAGLRYISGAHYGITSNDGTFNYIEGETITFYVGDIQLGYEVIPAETLTPYDLAQEDLNVTVNILRFLQTVDDDSNPNNGIKITDKLHENATNKTLDFADDNWKEKQPSEQEYIKIEGQLIPVRSKIDEAIYQLTKNTSLGSRYLIASSDAYQHFANTVDDIADNIEADVRRIANNSSCQTSSQCHELGIMLKQRIYCPIADTILFSDHDIDTSAFLTLVSDRENMIEIKNSLEDFLQLSTHYTGVCFTSSIESWPICNTEKKCVLTSNLITPTVEPIENL